MSLEKSGSSAGTSIAPSDGFTLGSVVWLFDGPSEGGSDGVSDDSFSSVLSGTSRDGSSSIEGSSIPISSSQLGSSLGVSEG